MEQRKLGSRGLVVSAIGLGCMSISEFCGGRDDGESIATNHRALDLSRGHDVGGQPLNLLLGAE